jgi:hypothetical protein
MPRSSVPDIKFIVQNNWVGDNDLVDMEFRKEDAMPIKDRALFFRQAVSEKHDRAPADLEQHEFQIIDLSGASMRHLVMVATLFDSVEYWATKTDDEANKKTVLVIKYSKREYILSYGTARQMGKIIERFTTAQICKHPMARALGVR